MTAIKPKRRWFQYSLRTLLVFVTVCALACSWLAVKMRQAERQREAAKAIEKLGGQVFWDSKASRRPAWLRKLVDSVFFDSVRSVDLSGTKVTDVELEYITKLSQLRELSLNESKITDARLAKLKALSQLQRLGIEDAEVTDPGLEHLGGFSQLQDLDLASTRVGDAGLKHLKGLSQLQSL